MSESANLAEGYIALGLTIVLFGSYGVRIKSPKVVDLKVDPMVFQAYYSPVVAVILLFVLTFTEFRFSGWGVLGAAMWVVSQIIAFMAIHRIGYGLAVAIWAGVTVLVGFLIGLLAFGDELMSVGGSVAGVVVLVFGIFGVVLAPSYLEKVTSAVRKRGKEYYEVGNVIDEPQDEKGSGALPDDEDTDPTDQDPADSELTDTPDVNDRTGGSVGGLNEEAERHPLLRDEVAVEDDLKKDKKRSVDEFVSGVVLSVIMGIINGSLQVPLKYYIEQFDLDDDESVSYLASFAIGVLIVTPPIFVIYFLVKREWPVFHFRSVAGPGFTTGVLWAFGYTGATYSTIWVGFAIGYPATQAAIFVSGLWGVFYFKEIQGRGPVSAFFAFALTIIGGVIIMSYFGQPA